MVKVFDNVFSNSNYVLNSLLNSGDNWIGGQVLPDDLYQGDESENYQYGNVMYDNMQPLTKEFNLVLDIINNPKFKIVSLVKVKANLNPRTTEIVKHGFHIDCDYLHCTTAIYYANTCNGFTEFEDGTVVKSVENRFVTFPSSLRHTGTTCTDKKARVVVNFNYFTVNGNEN